MNKILSGLALAAVLVLSALPAFAQGFSGSGSTNTIGPAQTATNQYYVISKQGSGIPYVTFVEAALKGGDQTNGAAAVNFYRPSREYNVTAAAAAGGTTITASTNGLVALDVLVLWTKSGDSYQRLTVASLSGSVITVGETIAAALTTSDIVYKMTFNARVQGTTATASTGTTAFARDRIIAGPNAGPIWVGTQNKPNLVEVVATNAPTLNIVSGRYGF